eukprot:gene7839-1039_t
MARTAAALHKGFFPLMLSHLVLFALGAVLSAAELAESHYTQGSSMPDLSLLSSVHLRSSSRVLHQDTSPEEMYRQQQQYILSRKLSNGMMWGHMADYVNRCSHIARLFSIGKSERGVDMLALSISSSGGGQEPSKPAFKYVANMHGDETSGRYLLLLLAEKLCYEYDTNASVKRLIDTMRLVLVPTMNPDGYALGPRRGNSNFVDLNRNFPDFFQSPAGTDLRLLQGREAAETLAIMDLSLSQRFVASANLHEGALVVSYPLDGNRDGSYTSGQSNSPDNKTFRRMALTYARLHKTMSKTQGSRLRPYARLHKTLSKTQGSRLRPYARLHKTLSKTQRFPRSRLNRKLMNILNLMTKGSHLRPYARLHKTMSKTQGESTFEEGTVNGAKWYVIYGGMQDWNYFAAECMEVTLELSDQKDPSMQEMAKLWGDNEVALLQYPIDSVFTGFRGQVTSTGGRKLAATVKVKKIEHNITTNEKGYYFRPLAPGKYKIRFSAPEYSSKTIMVKVPKNNLGTVVDSVEQGELVSFPSARREPPLSLASTVINFSGLVTF